MIVVFGSVNLDLIFPLAHLPAPGETVLGRAMRMEPGGKGANQAVAASRDGSDVVFAGAVGEDAFADLALGILAGGAIDVRRIRRVPTLTGCAAISVDQEGHNMISVASGANLHADSDDVEDALLGHATTVLLQMETDRDQIARLIGRAKERGARVVLNLAPAAFLPPEVLRAVDVVVVNDEEAAWLGTDLGTGVNAQSLQASLGNVVVVTLGNRGVEAADGTRSYALPAHKVDSIDSTAAGDCFTGVLAAALDRGLPLDAALKRANVAGALCCTRSGTQGSLPTAREIDAAVQPD